MNWYVIFKDGTIEKYTTTQEAERVATHFAQIDSIIVDNEALQVLIKEIKYYEE